MVKNIRHTAIRVSSRHLKKRPPPLSIRLNEEEKAFLVYRANGLPISTYIKSVLFPEELSSKPKNPRARHTHLAEVAKLLAILGQTQIAESLSILATAAESGSLDMNETVTKALLKACTDIEEIRTILMRELGKQVPSSETNLRLSKPRITAAEFKILSQMQANTGKGRP